MISKTVRIVLLAVAALLLATKASAQTTIHSTFTVSATVAANCRIDSAGDIAIPSWDPTGTANSTKTGTIAVRCTKGTSYTIDLNSGVYTGELTHTNGTDKLPFRFYASDCATAFTPIAASAPNRSAQNHTICAGLDLTQTALLDLAIAGTYSGSAVVDVTF